MNAYWVILIQNIAVLTLTGFIFWLTRNPLSFLILLCGSSVETKEQTTAKKEEE